MEGHEGWRHLYLLIGGSPVYLERVTNCENRVTNWRD